ncbi:MAG: hypothetical protein ACREO3_08975, partial [Arenimonas sp.]
MSQPLVLVVLWAFYPLWLVAGWFDYRHHRYCSLARRGGVREAALHLSMLVLVTLGLVATLAWLPTYALMVLLLALALAYLAAASSNPRWVDGGARTRRFSRHVSALFEFLPLFALALFLAEHWPRLDLLAYSDWTLEWRTPALPAGLWAAVFVPVAAFAIGPGLAELRRAWRARR